MKRFAHFTALLSIFILGISCSGNTLNGDEEKVKSAFIKSRGIKPEVFQFSEIKLVREVTVEDSINYFLGATEEIIKSHAETLKKLNDLTALTKQESGSYSDEVHDRYIQQFTSELNHFADAYNGIFSEESWTYDYTYRQLYRLRQMDRDKVLGKIYAITYTLNKKTYAQVWCFDPAITTTVGGAMDDEATKKSTPGNLELIHFKRYEELSEMEEVPQADFMEEGGDIREFDESGNPIE